MNAFADFTVTEFPTPCVGYVYAIFAVAEDGSETPFYVGETGRFQGRMNDYRLAGFGAPTDFHVGEAIWCLQTEKKTRVVVKYRRSADEKLDRQKDQDQILAQLRGEGYLLLNDLGRYDYRMANKIEELGRVQEFCERLVATFKKAA